MSQWTYIKGCLEVSISPFEKKEIKVQKPAEIRNPKKEPELEPAWEKYRRALFKSFYLPYPEEQFKINTPTMLERYCKKTKKNPEGKETVLHTEANIYSLPRAKKYLDEAFKLLPYGETGFTYAVKQDWTNSGSGCSSLEYPCLYKYYKESLEKLYYNEDSWHRYTFEDLVKYQHIDKDCWINYCEDIVIGIMESLRWCSADELQEGLEKFFKYLEEHEFTIGDGYLEWVDNYEENLRHTWRSYGYDGYVFETINLESNQVIYRKSYEAPKDEKGFVDWDAFDKKGYVVKEETFGDKK